MAKNGSNTVVFDGIEENKRQDDKSPFTLPQDLKLS